LANFFSPFLDIFLKKDKKEKELKAFIKQITGEEPKKPFYLFPCAQTFFNK